MKLRSARLGRLAVDHCSSREGQVRLGEIRQGKVRLEL